MCTPETRKPKPLHAQAAKNTQADTLKYLLSLGADHTAKDYDDRQAVHLAAMNGAEGGVASEPLGRCRRCVCRVCAAAVASYAFCCGAGQRRLCAVFAGRRGCQGSW